MQEQTSSRTLPGNFVGREITQDRVTRYSAEKQPLLSKAIGKTDTGSIWYTFRQIEDIYKELVFLKADGLRFYLGAYEENHADFADQLCLLMVPTRLNPETNRHRDVVLEEEPEFEKRLEISRSLGLVKDFNYGSPCPPVCPPHELRYTQ